MFSTNLKNKAIDVVNISDLATPFLAFSINLAPYGGRPNSVDARDGVVAGALDGPVKTDPGSVAFFSSNGQLLSRVTVGPQPDMVTFTPDGNKVLVAHEGEPSDDYTVDPEGSISIIDVSGGAASVTPANVRSADFRAFNRDNIDPRIRVFGPRATVPQDLEPEYIAVSPDSKTAYVSLQEANAIAVVDIDTATVTRLIALGFKDHLLPGNGLDASDRDGGVNIRNWPLLGMYQPDAIAAYEVGGKRYLVTVNEGDSRAYAGYNEETRVASLKLDPAAFPEADLLKLPNALGRLRVTKANGDANGDGLYEKIYVFGARSFSIWSDQGTPVFDSGDQLEQITAAAYPDTFNSDHRTNLSAEARSPNKGPEPEGLAVGHVGGRWYAFICFERIGGVIIYDITDPAQPRFVQYLNNRNFYLSPKSGTAGDLGPEIVRFVKEQDSPNGKPLLLVANEVSGTVSIYQVQ